MKRLIAVVALLVPLWGCAQPSEAPANRSANLNNNTSATPAATATAPAVSEAAITDQEKQIWDAIKRKDEAGINAMLTDDFLYVDSNGVSDKKGTVHGLKNFSPTEVTFSDWKVLPIDADAAVVIYQVAVKGTNNGQSIPPTPVRASSVWVKRGDKWLALFHQDAEIVTSPPNSPAADKKPEHAAPANANANSAPPPPQDARVEAADPITKEKQVWEELKHKNWDAFASDLDERQIEIDPERVYDKAGSIASAKEVDFNKYTLSDFKQVKIDDDGSIVTYLVKSTDGKEQMRHSTVWTKRGDKWLALFHHGILLMPPAKPAK